MRQVRLIATKGYSYAGRALSPGDAFEAPEDHANVLKLNGSATDAPSTSYRTKVSEPSASDDRGQDVASPSTRRRYKRRDLVAET